MGKVDIQYTGLSREELVAELARAKSELARLQAGGATRQQRLFELLVDSVTDYAILALDPEGRVTTWNQGAERISGYRHREIVGTHFSAFFLREDIRSGRPGRLLAEALGEGRAEEEGWRRRKDGSRFWAHSTVTTLRDDHGEAVGFAMVMHDLTEREQARAQQRKIDQLQEADVLKDQFLSMLSHELRTPLNAVLGFGSILEDGLAGPLTENQRGYVRKMESGAETLLALINDLLDMSRIQAGRFHLSPEPMRLQEEVDRVLVSLSPLAERKQHVLRSEVSANMPPILADPQRVDQVLINFISNAVKYSPPGSTISVQARVERGWLRCEVQDNGLGIDPEDIPRLFQRFSQLDSPVHRGGTGLGLSISKALIEAHGGEVGVESEPGHGATFWFTLPLAR